MIKRTLATLLALSVAVGVCSSSDSPSASFDADAPFLLSERLVEGVTQECIDLADQFLETSRQQIELLGDLDFAGWVTEGLFHVEDEAPELVAEQADVIASYDAAECPQGYLAATIVAHGGRYDPQSPGAAIWWAGLVASSMPRLAEGAADEAQEQSWLDLVGADTRDASSRLAVPDQNQIDSIVGCAELGTASTNLLQQQLYAISAVPFGESFDKALEPLEAATNRVEQLRSFSDCDANVRETLLRRADAIEVAGTNAVIAYGTELDASWTLWSTEMLQPGIEIGVNVLDPETALVEVVATNVGNIPVRILSVTLADTTADELELDMVPEATTSVELDLDGLPEGDVLVELTLQTPTGTTQTVSTAVAIS